VLIVYPTIEQFQLLYRYYLVFAVCGHTNALFIWAFFPETAGRRLEEMDSLFEESPIFVANTQYTKTQDRHAAEKELRERTFVPGGLTENAADYGRDSDTKELA
jgi:hypothetical protein